MNIREWLKLQPNDDEIEMIEGVNIIRQKKIEELLDEMTDQNWSTRNYQSKYFKVGEVDYISASLELVVNYWSDDILIQRTFVGAVSFQLSFFSGQHIDNTAKSLCIVNAASEIGNRMGRNLNPSVHPVIEGKKLNKLQQKIKAAVKVAPDAGIQAQWNTAVERQNMKMVKYLYAMYTITPGEDGYHFVKIENAS